MPEENSSDRDLQVRVQHQVAHIRSAFAEQATRISMVPDGEGGVNHMHAEDHILVREEHAAAVHEIFNRGTDFEPGLVRRVVPGVAVLRQRQPWGPYGRGRARRDRPAARARNSHPGSCPDRRARHPCPATEPQEAYYETEPYPPVCTENSGAGIRVYVADTGLLRDAGSHHPWLQGVRRAPDPDGRLQEPDPAKIALDGTETIPPYAGHGTFVAGVIRCMAPQAEVIVSNIFNVAGSALESDLVAELDRALSSGVDVLNLSISTRTRSNLGLLGFDHFRRRLQQYKGVVCVVAAGNDGSPVTTWPGGYPEMVSVGALGADWRGRARFSNYGGWVDVYAPGRDLVNAYATGPYECHEYPYKGDIRKFYGMARWSGTSFSTPVVTGLVAARMSRTGETGQEAAAALLAEARANAVPGVGAILLPPR